MKKNFFRRKILQSVLATSALSFFCAASAAPGPNVWPNQKVAVIAVDSSGSNDWTDPTDLRIMASNTTLKNIAKRNADVLGGVVAGRPTAVAALDFDDSFIVLSDFTDPASILDIFDSIDSWGGTDIAQAINKSASMINDVRPVPTPPFVLDANTPRQYILTDMDNNAGPAPVVTAILNANSQNIVTHIGHLAPLVTRSAPADLRGEPMRTKIAHPMDPIIEATLAGGGSYAFLDDPASYQTWADLVLEFDIIGNPWLITQINLPLGVQMHRYVQAGNPEPTYFITAPKSGEITVIVDGKGNFVPDIKRNGTGTQSPGAGQDEYELKFPVVAGATYQIKINEPAAAAGMYNIVARQTAVAFAAPTATPVPANNKLALLLGALLVVGFVSRQKLRSNR